MNNFYIELFEPGHSGPWRNGNKKVFDTSLISRTGNSPPDVVYSHSQDTHFFAKEES